MSPKNLASAFVALATLRTALASVEDVSILPTPPMGFNNWARFECNLNETLFTETADAMVYTGLRDAGYDRINLDDCWMTHSRDKYGALQWNATLFPHGLPWLGNYFKERGFHFGIYEDAGTQTCGGYPGSQGYEEIDAKTFKSWGIDYLKLDGCNVDPGSEEQFQGLYGKWHEVLSKMDEPLIFSESAPAYFSGSDNNTDWFRTYKWLPQYGELARHSYDIRVFPENYTPAQYWSSIMLNYKFNTLIARYQEPGFYNDPDFIIADWPISLDEKKSQFALWSSLGAPLIISSYIPDLTNDEIDFLTNKDIIAVDQDAMAQQATLVSQDGTFDVLTRSLANGDRLVTVLNRGSSENTITVPRERMGLENGKAVMAKDLWTGKTHKMFKELKITLPTHATAIYRLSGVESVTPTGMVFNTLSLKCMTATGNEFEFSKCRADDSQVWRISSGGLVSPLSAPAKCLTASRTGASMKKCSPFNKHQHWDYHISGNLINEATGQCLMEGGNGVADCANELDSQVFGLPAGVKIVKD